MSWVYMIAGGAAGFCVGALGFADAVLANAVFAIGLGTLGPETLLAIVSGGAITYSAHLFLIRRNRDWICWRKLSTLGWLLVFGLPTVLLATFYLKPLIAVHLDVVNSVLGVLLLLVCGYNLLGRPVTLTERTASRSTPVIGVLSGILGTVAGLSGLFTTLWVKARREWSQTEARGVYQPFVGVMHLVVLGLLFMESPMETPGTPVIAYIVFSVLGLMGSMMAVATGMIQPQKLEKYLPQLVNGMGVVAATNLLYHVVRN